jgi:hypothetical protein
MIAEGREMCLFVVHYASHRESEGVVFCGPESNVRDTFSAARSAIDTVGLGNSRNLIFTVQHSTWASMAIRWPIDIGCTMSDGGVKRQRILCVKGQARARLLRAHHENQADTLRSPRQPMGKSLPRRRAYGDTMPMTFMLSSDERAVFASVHGGRCSRDRGVVHVTSVRMQPVPASSGHCCPIAHERPSRLPKRGISVISEKPSCTPSRPAMEAISRRQKVASAARSARSLCSCRSCRQLPLRQLT